MSHHNPVHTTMRNINGKWVIVNPSVEDITPYSPSNQAGNYNTTAVQEIIPTSAGRNSLNVVGSSQRKRRTSTELSPATQAKKVYLGEQTDKIITGSRSSMECGLKDSYRVDKMANDFLNDETIETNPEVAQFLSGNRLDDRCKSLMLPTKYQILLEKFEHLDTVVRYLFNLKQRVNWKNIKKSVEMMAGRSFTLNCLEQIRYIFPMAYTFEIQTGSGRNIKNNQLLVIAPNLDSNGCMFGDDMKMTNATTTLRSHQFRSNLVALMKFHHQRFLSIECPHLRLDGREVKRWHPKFLVENVADIPHAYIPKPSHEKDENSARRKYEQAKERIEEKIQKLIQKIEEKKAMEAKTCGITDVLHDDKQRENSRRKKIECDKISLNLKGIPTTLLEKIRKKEKLKRIRYMCENDDKSKIIDSLHKLPEIAKPLQTIFTSQKKSTLPIDFVKRKLLESSRNVTTIRSVDAHLRLLMATCSNWLSIIPLREVNYVRINRNRRLCDVLTELKIAISIAEQST